METGIEIVTRRATRGVPVSRLQNDGGIVATLSLVGSSVLGMVDDYDDDDSRFEITGVDVVAV
ncbi:hypothetical protein GCM10008992_31550 [Halorubrum aquaticum]